MKKCLVTGASGFVGGHLIEFLLGAGEAVAAVDQAKSPLFAGLKGEFSFRAVDILDREAVADLILATRPDFIFHLAAQSYPGVSWDKPALTFEVNVLGALNLMDGVRNAGVPARIILAGSSAEYAPVDSKTPIREDTPLSPSSPYGVSKLATDHVARLYVERYGLAVIRARPFFLVGPRKRGDVCSDLAQGIVAIERGLRRDLAVGNMDVVRDFLDVRDGVEAMWLLAGKGVSGEAYNICSGQGCVLREVLETLKCLAKKPVLVRNDPAKSRKLDEMIRVGDPGRLVAMGWTPRRKIAETLKEILEYWRSEGE